MATWSGWQNQLLNAAGILNTPPCRDFLTGWAQHATTNCTRNPIDLSHKVTGSTTCRALPGIFPHAMNYTSHAHAASAFSDEVHMSFAKALLDALNTGNPYQSPSRPNDVASVLVSWGSDKYANVYLAAVQAQSGGGGGSSGKAPHAHSGWQDLRTTLNHRMPAALRSSDRNTSAALRALSKARKVRL